LTKIDRSRVVREFRDIEVFAISKNIRFFATLEDAKLLSTIKDIKFLTIYKDIKFLIKLTSSISKEKLFLFITKECVKKKQM